jgi:hypothetical protein
MSTDLYRIRVLDLSREQRRVTFRVFLVYYDWSGVPTDPSFFFRILWDEADARFGGGGPLGHEVTVDQFLDEKFVDQNTQRFVEKVKQLSYKDHTFPDGKAPTFVYESFKDEAKLTQGDFEVTVTDPRWIAHLKKGQTWQTTSYETKAVMPKGRQTKKVAPAKKAAKKAAPAKKVAKKVTRRGSRAG